MRIRNKFEKLVNKIYMENVKDIEIDSINKYCLLTYHVVGISKKLNTYYILHGLEYISKIVLVYKQIKYIEMLIYASIV